jgi:hypothetical protein
VEDADVGPLTGFCINASCAKPAVPSCARMPWRSIRRSRAGGVCKRVGIGNPHLDQASSVTRGLATSLLFGDRWRSVLHVVGPIRRSGLRAWRHSGEWPAPARADQSKAGVVETADHGQDCAKRTLAVKVADFSPGVDALQSEPRNASPRWEHRLRLAVSPS